MFNWQTHFFNSFLITLIGLSQSCSREPQFRKPQLGEKIFIQPIAINYLLRPKLPTTQAIKLNAMWGGRALAADKGDPLLNFYGTDGKLKNSRKWADLVESYKTTSCSNQQIATLDGYLMGAALICDGSLDLRNITRIEAVDSGGERRSSTSWGVYRIQDDVSGISIGFY